jgi:hypothetical protein
VIQTLRFILNMNAGPPRSENGKAVNVKRLDGETIESLRRGRRGNSFSFGDRVAFDDTGSPAVNSNRHEFAPAVWILTRQATTLSGTGAITSTGVLTKRGTGTSNHHLV